MGREEEKMKTFFTGLKYRKKYLKEIIVVETKHDHSPGEEARQSKVKVIGLVDTNSDPTNVDYMIPSNDDAIKVISYMTSVMADAINEGRNNMAQTIMAQTEGAAVAK